MGKFNIILVCMLTLACVVAPHLALAVEVAPRISDREIVESLTELKQQQKALNQRMDDMNQRITDLIHNLDKRFEAIDKRFATNDRRFEAMDRRFKSMMNWMLTLFGICDYPDSWSAGIHDLGSPYCPEAFKRKNGKSGRQLHTGQQIT